MRIAVASGKGGTGKTFVSTNLFNVMPDSAIYADCDVEEPNGHLFLKPDLQETFKVNIKIPEVDPGKCILCGKCAQVCEYNAIIAGKKVLVFAELCHGCGSCSYFCPEGAITEIDRNIGRIEQGYFKGKSVFTGILNIGEPMSPPVIREMLRLVGQSSMNRDVILDSPPGTSCPMIETTNNADFVILVTEPTPFGLHDLALAVNVVKKLNKPFAVIINKSFSDNDLITNYCSQNKINILSSIPFDRNLAISYSRGELASGLNYYKNIFLDIYNKIKGSII